MRQTVETVFIFALFTGTAINRGVNNSFFHRQKFFLRKKHKIVRLDNPLRRVRFLRQQVRWLVRTFPHHLCLIQVGSYFKAYGWQAEVLHQTAGLVLNKKWRGFSQACGFPQKKLPAVLSKLQAQRLPVVVVEETGQELRHAKERLLAMMIEYPENEVGQN